MLRWAERVFTPSGARAKRGRWSEEIKTARAWPRAAQHFFKKLPKNLKKAMLRCPRPRPRHLAPLRSASLPVGAPRLPARRPNALRPRRNIYFLKSIQKFNRAEFFVVARRGASFFSERSPSAARAVERGDKNREGVASGSAT